MSPAAFPVLPLELLAAGEHGYIRELDGSPAFVHRLQEMGIRLGAAVTVLRPGSPCLLAVGNHRFSLRTEDVVGILVEVAP
jgi:ferrous iron transport protein A